MLPPPPKSTLFPYTTLFRSQKAFSMITRGDDVLEAVIAGVNIVEEDQLDDSVGYGGLPNAERSEEHTSELQSRFDLVCRLLLEKKKKKKIKKQLKKKNITNI